MKSGNINFLEPSGPLQACNGTALHLHLHTMNLVFMQFSAISCYFISLKCTIKCHSQNLKHYPQNLKRCIQNFKHYPQNLKCYSQNLKHYP